MCRLPAECPACGLVLILSTHLARSYHHLFPLRNWVEVSWADAARSRACHACLAAFPERDRDKEKRKEAAAAVAAAAADDDQNKRAATAAPKGVSESGRYACEVCGNHFCIDCDVYAHEVVHNCPGCQSGTGGHDRNGTSAGGAHAAAVNGNHSGGANSNGGLEDGAHAYHGETMLVDS